MILTKEEKVWVKKVNALMNKCPSERLGFYTIGDPVVGIYDRTHQDEIDDEGGDLIDIIHREGWDAIEEINFPSSVQGVCG